MDVIHQQLQYDLLGTLHHGDHTFNPLSHNHEFIQL